MPRRRSRLSEFFDSARKMRGKCFLSFYHLTPCQASQEGELEWFVLASKKGVDKRAVRRNRARRRIREVIRGMSLGPVPPGLRVQWVVMAGRAAVVCPWEELCAEVSAHWKSIQDRVVESAPASPC